MTGPNNFSTMSDEELFALVRGNDQEAFRALYRRYDRRLYAYCLRVVKDRELAEDTFQTVVLAIYEKRDSFLGGNFASWLFTIARHAALKASQKNQRTMNTTTSLDDAEEISADEVSERGSDTLLQDALQKSIGKLPQEFREPLELRYFQERSYEEISSIIGISLSLTKVRIFRAKQMLQKIMSPYLQELQ